jgi:hypothetical protein
MISIKELSHETTFLVETDTEINIINKQNLYFNKEIDINNITVRITEERIDMIDSTIIKYCGYEFQHVVKEDFPIIWEGILKADFLCDATLIDYVI